MGSIPSPEDLTKAHELYQKKEPRWREYWIAVEGVKNGFRHANLGDAASAIAILLKRW